MRRIKPSVLSKKQLRQLKSLKGIKEFQRDAVKELTEGLEKNIKKLLKK